MVEDFGDFEPEYIRLTEDKREIYDFRFLMGTAPVLCGPFGKEASLTV